MPNHVPSVFLRLIYHYKHCVAIKPLSSGAFSMFAFLGLFGQLNWKQQMLKETFMEMSEFHWENMFSPFKCTNSSSLVNVSPWE